MNLKPCLFSSLSMTSQDDNMLAKTPCAFWSGSTLQGTEVLQTQECCRPRLSSYAAQLYPVDGSMTSAHQAKVVKAAAETCWGSNMA